MLLLLERVDLVERHKQLIQPMELLVEMVERQHLESSALAVDLEELEELLRLQLEAREARDNLLEVQEELVAGLLAEVMPQGQHLSLAVVVVVEQMLPTRMLIPQTEGLLTQQPSLVLVAALLPLLTG